MKDKWRIPFTALMALTFGLAYVAAVSMSASPVLFLSILWVFSGLVISIICMPLTTGQTVRLSVVWLLALWSDRVRDWAMK